MGKTNLGRTVAELREDLPLGRVIPNTLTLVGLCCGATAIRFAVDADWKAAVAAIVCATVFDMLDGRAARMLGTDSRFGAQLDSLADLVSFGIAPSVLVYLWALSHAGGAGWAMALVFGVCCAIRLARFNVESESALDEEDDDIPVSSHFTGVPAPAAACLALLPMVLSFQFADRALHSPLLNAAVMASIAILMVSRIPTPSLKHVHIPRHLRASVGAFSGLLLGFVILFPWSTMAVGLCIYLAGIPAAIALAREPQ